jgi:hypothetical protein
MVAARSACTADRVHGVLQAGGERRDDQVGVVAGAVEPPVHGVLHPSPQRGEQRCRRQRRSGDGHP